MDVVNDLKQIQFQSLNISRTLGPSGLPNIVIPTTFVALSFQISLSIVSYFSNNSLVISLAVLINYLHYDVVSTSATLAISFTSSTVIFLVRPLSQHNISGINDSLYVAYPYSFLYQPNVNANGFPSVITTINYFYS